MTLMSVIRNRLPAAGLGGRAGRHLRYVRVESVSSMSGGCK